MEWKERAKPFRPPPPLKRSDSSLQVVSQLNIILKGINDIVDACISAKKTGDGIITLHENKIALIGLQEHTTGATRAAVENMAKSTNLGEDHARDLINAVKEVFRLFVDVMKGNQPLPAIVPLLIRERENVLVAINQISHDLQGWKRDVVRMERKEKEKIAPQELKRKAAALLTDLKGLVKATKENDQEVFITTTRKTLNRVKSLLDLAKNNVSLEDDEVALRDATRELINAAQLKISSSSDDDTQISVALVKVTDAIRALLLSVESSSDTPVRSRTASVPVVPTMHSGPLKGISKDNEKMAAQRGNVVKELFETENTYRDQLAIVLKRFVEPMNMLESEQIKNSHHIQNCLAALPVIKVVTDKIRDEVLTRMARNDPDLGQVFLSIAPELHSYQSYVNDYDEMIRALDRIQKKSKTVNTILESLGEHVEQASYTFALILPIQRPPRYEMLLREMCKYTMEGSESYTNLKTALKKIKAVNNVINLMKREEDNRRKIAAVAKKLVKATKDIKDLPGIEKGSNKGVSIYAPGRMYIREGALWEVLPHGVRSGNKVKNFYWFMFSDCLIKCKPKGKNYIWIETIYFDNVSLKDISDSKGGISHMFVLVPKDIPVQKGEAKKAAKREKQGKVDVRLHNFSCLSENEKMDWMKDLEESIGLSNLFKEVGKSRIATIRISKDKKNTRRGIKSAPNSTRI